MANRVGADKINNNNNNNKPSPCFNRSITIHSSRTTEMTNKPLVNLHNSTSLQRNGSIKSLVSPDNSWKGKVRKLCSIFELSRKYPSTDSSKKIQSLDSPSISNKNALTISSLSQDLYFPANSKNTPDTNPPCLLPGTEDRVVIYFTSLRGIRKTFQDCHSVRMIFRGFRVNVDERDVSMDSAYRKEVQKVLREENVSLPQVFVKGKYIGGADVVKQLLEAGELVRLVKGLPLRAMENCGGCDDLRFMPCGNCDGSRKVFDEEGGRTRRCTECNENGLVRCPVCCS